MKVRFKDDTVKNCTAPTEQKVFRGDNGAGWILLLNLIGEISSAALDEILTADNVSELTFLSDADDVISTANAYNKVSSCTIRHAERPQDTRAEIQLTKGV